MSRICPVGNEVVLYLNCIECDTKDRRRDNDYIDKSKKVNNNESKQNDKYN